jgi:pimeloyl-ACP methyl ester carboxylesterase
MGDVAAVARGLADSFRVLEPLQRGSGSEPLTVARHVADLHELIETRCTDEPPALVGHSWGAMLALAYAAVHPDSAGPLALIACGTFDAASRERMRATLDERMDDGTRRRMESLERDYPDPDRRLIETAKLIVPLYRGLSSYELMPDQDETVEVDGRAHQETWDDMLRLQEEGMYPAAFSAIDSPVLMLHGAHDPHPGRMIRASLQPHLPQLEYHEWKRCGHYPWMEKAVRDEFFSVLSGWLARRLAGGSRDDGVES